MRKPAVLCGIVLAAAVVVRLATAQLDPGYKIYLIEDGVRVGEVFVPEREPGTAVYEEHWVLYAKYRYPGPNNLRGLVIKAEPSEVPYRSTEDFFQRVPFGPKSTYIHITATESLVKEPLAR